MDVPLAPRKVCGTVTRGQPRVTVSNETPRALKWTQVGDCSQMLAQGQERCGCQRWCVMLRRRRRIKAPTSMFLGSRTSGLPREINS